MNKLSPSQLSVIAGILSLVIVGSYAVFTGGTVTTDVTPTHIRVEVVGKPR